MGNLDVDKAMQTLVEHGFIDKDGHPINVRSDAISRHAAMETCNNKQVINKLVSMQDVVNLIDELNAISFYEANEHSKECYYDIRNAILAMPEQEPCDNCEVGNPCIYCKHEFESQESEEISREEIAALLARGE